jgi:hypothetical protein
MAPTFSAKRVITAFHMMEDDVTISSGSLQKEVVVGGHQAKTMDLRPVPLSG